MQQNRFFIFSEKRNGLAFQKWTFLKCPFSENCNTNLFNVFGGNYNCGNAGHDYHRIIRFSQARVVKIQCKHIIIIVREYIRSGRVISRIYVITTECRHYRPQKYVPYLKTINDKNEYFRDVTIVRVYEKRKAFWMRYGHELPTYWTCIRYTIPFTYTANM